MKKRYIFFRGILDTLDLYTDEFVKIYTEQGDECLVLDAAHMDKELSRLEAFLSLPVTAAISLNQVGLHLEFENGKNIWDHYQIPFYNILMDHPFHYKKALDTAPKHTVLLCMDRNHIEYVRRFFPNIQKAMFFPHAGIESPKNQQERIPICDRSIDVLYAGGLSRYAAEGLIPDLGRIAEFDAFSLVQYALERLIRYPALTTEFVIEQCLQEQGLYFEDKKLGELLAQLRFIDSFAVSFYREQVIRMLVENGVTVTVFGAGWDRCEWEHPNLVYGGEIPPIQILELMGRSRVVLNTMTWFKRGAHDRIFNGMLAGAAVVSDRSEYMQEHFQDGRELNLFSLEHASDVVKTIKQLLRDPQRAQHMADRGYRAASGSHMWKNRLQDVHLLESRI